MYRRIIAQWLAKEGPFAPKDDDAPITIEEVTAAYWTFAEKYYRYDQFPKRGDCINLKKPLAILNRLYASLPAHNFGPLDFKTVMGEMIRQGWCRRHVSHQCSRLKTMFN